MISITTLAMRTQYVIGLSIEKYSLEWSKIRNLHLLFLTQIPQNFSSPAPCVARATASTHIRPVYVSILARIGSPSSNLRLLAIFGGVCLGKSEVDLDTQVPEF